MHRFLVKIFIWLSDLAMGLACIFFGIMALTALFFTPFYQRSNSIPEDDVWFLIAKSALFAIVAILCQFARLRNIYAAAALSFLALSVIFIQGFYLLGIMVLVMWMPIVLCNLTSNKGIDIDENV